LGTGFRDVSSLKIPENSCTSPLVRLAMCRCVTGRNACDMTASSTSNG
jgi:hypothetical protein